MTRMIIMNTMTTRLAMTMMIMATNHDDAANHDNDTGVYNNNIGDLPLQ